MEVRPRRVHMKRNATRTDVYQEVTDKMIKALEAGVTPWQKPWTSAGRPKSLSTGKPYRGVNVFLLSLEHVDPAIGLSGAQRPIAGSTCSCSRWPRRTAAGPRRGSAPTAR